MKCPNCNVPMLLTCAGKPCKDCKHTLLRCPVCHQSLMPQAVRG